MPIQSGKYVTPAWQNGGAPAITAEELTAIGQSIEQNQTNILEKLSINGGTMNGNINMNGNIVSNSGEPSSESDLVNKGYVDSSFMTGQPVLLQTISYTATKENAPNLQYYSFGPWATSIGTSYEFIIIAIYGTFVLGSPSTLTILGENILQSGTYNIETPIVLFLAKGGTNNSSITYYGLLNNTRFNITNTSHKLSVQNYANADSIDVNATIKFYGWNPI